MEYKPESEEESVRADKRKLILILAEEAETAAVKRDIKRLYAITRTPAGTNTKPTCSVKDKGGKIITNESQERTRWAEHFKETLNRPSPEQRPSIFPADSLLNVNTNPPTKAEISKAVKAIKAGKAAGPDGIPSEALKAEVSITIV